MALEVNSYFDKKKTFNIFLCETKKARPLTIGTYSRFLFSRPSLSRITAYLEVKIWSLFKHENLTTGNKILWKRGEIAPKEQYLLFSIIFLIYL